MSASDNPFLNMGMLGMMSPNVYEDAAYAQGQKLKLQGYYTGTAGNMPPTDALGKPIQNFVDANNTAQTNYQKQLAAFNASQPPQGMTINNSGQGQGAGGTVNYAGLGQWGPAIQELTGNYQATQAAKTPQQLYNEQQSNLYRQQNLRQMNDAATAKAGEGGFGNSQGGAFNPGQAVSPLALAAMSGSAPTASTGGATPPAPPDMRQAYLDALANPGPVRTQGAAVPASPPLGTPSVMTAFLAAHPQGGSKGAGNYDNSGFFNTLNQLGTA
jgi:hypothetical protein